MSEHYKVCRGLAQLLVWVLMRLRKPFVKAISVKTSKHFSLNFSMIVLLRPAF